EIEDPDALPDLYARVLAAFPDALVEDPHDLPEINALVEPHAARVSYDAPIHTVSDLDAVPIAAQTFNIKPSRVGRLRDLFALRSRTRTRCRTSTRAFLPPSRMRSSRTRTTCRRSTPSWSHTPRGCRMTRPSTRCPTSTPCRSQRRRSTSSRAASVGYAISSP